MISSISYDKALEIMKQCDAITKGYVYSNTIYLKENHHTYCRICKEYIDVIEFAIVGNNYSFVYLKGNTIKTELDIKKEYIKIYVDENEITLGIKKR